MKIETPFPPTTGQRIGASLGRLLDRILMNWNVLLWAVIGVWLLYSVTAFVYDFGVVSQRFLDYTQWFYNYTIAQGTPA